MERVGLIFLSITVATLLLVGASYGALWLMPYLDDMPMPWPLIGFVTLPFRDGRLADAPPPRLIVVAHQLSDKAGNAGLAAALHALGVQDGADFLQGGLQIVIDHDIVIFRPVADFVVGPGHALGHYLFCILGPDAQAALELGMAGRQHKNAHQIATRLLAQLLRALPIDVEQHVTALGQRHHHRRPGRAVMMAPEHQRVLQEGAALRPSAANMLKARGRNNPCPLPRRCGARGWCWRSS